MPAVERIQQGEVVKITDPIDGFVGVIVHTASIDVALSILESKMQDIELGKTVGFSQKQEFDNGPIEQTIWLA